MLKQPITFDSFIRGLMVVAALFGIGLLIDRLSSVLLPFFIAWLLAYLMYPLVKFIQYKCRLRNRTLSIIVAAIVVLATLTGFFALIIPPTIEEFSKFSGLVKEFSDRYLNDTRLAPYIKEFIDQYLPQYQGKIMDIVQNKSFLDAVQALLTQLWNFVYQTVDFAFGLVGSLIVLLYMFFLMYSTILLRLMDLFPLLFECLHIHHKHFYLADLVDQSHLLMKLTILLQYLLMD